MQKKRVLMFFAGLCLCLLVGCSSGGYKPGTYEGRGQGYGKTPIRLSVTIAQDGSIYQINILEEQETKEIGSKALDQLKEEVLQNNKEQVETVSGATRTTEGFREALKQALEKAKGK